MSTLQPAARLRQIRDEITTLRGEGARVLYRLGALLREVEDGELWRAGGCATYGEWLENEAQVSRTTAHRAALVARHFNEDIAVRYGLEKLSLGLRWMALTRADEQPGDLLAADLRLRDARGRFVSVPFHEASLRQIEAALALLLDARDARPKLDDGLDARLKRLDAALPVPPAGVRPVRERVQVQRARDGKISLSFRQIPLDELEGFLEAVRRELLG